MTLADFAAASRPPKLCAVGKSPLREEIEDGLRSGISCVMVSRYLRAEGVPVGHEAIRMHGLGACCCG